MVQVLGDGEENGSLERSRHGLPGVDIALEDDAPDRRADAGFAEIGLLEAEVGQGDLDLGQRIGVGGDRPLVGRLRDGEVLGGDDVAAGERLPALVFAARLLDRRLGLGHPGAGGGEPGTRTRDPGLEPVGVEFGQHLARGDGAVVVDMDVAHGAGQLVRDVDLVGGLDGARRRHDHGEAARADRLGDPAGPGLAIGVEPVDCGSGHQAQHGEAGEQAKDALPTRAVRRADVENGLDRRSPGARPALLFGQCGLLQVTAAA